MSKKRVVITGAGIVSCIGNDLDTVEASLRQGKSGIRAVEKFTELGLRSQVAGRPEIDIEARIDRKQLRFMGDAAAYAQIALEDAIKQAGLSPEQVSHPRTGLIMGSGGGSPANQIEAADTLREKGIRRVGPYQVTRCMSSTVSACLATNFKVKGINYSITSACSTSAHCIGAAAQQIAWGMQDVMFAGGGEELSWGMALLFDGMGALSSKYNAPPSWPRSWALVRRATARTWSRRPATAPWPACARPWRGWPAPSTTSTPMAPPRRWATCRRCAPCAPCLATRCRRFPAPSR